MVGIPVPQTIAKSDHTLFSGSIGWIVWRLFLLAGGAILIGYAFAAGSYFAVFMVGTVFSIALSSTLRGLLTDFWQWRWTKL